MKTIQKLFGLAFFAVLLGAPHAKANADYPLNSPNTALIPYPGPYGTVDVNLTSGNTAVITFTSSNPTLFRFGGAQAVNVNVNTGGSALTVTINSPGSASVDAPPGTQNISSFGSMNVSIDNTDGSGDATTPFQFTIVRSTGTWASAGSVLTNDNQGFLAAAHIFVYTAEGVNVATGFAGNGGSSVPDSGTVAGLLGIALLALATLRRRFGLT